MASTIASDPSTRETTHVINRLVQPGSWQPCTHCHDPIDFVPGGFRAQTTCKTYVGDAIQRVQHFHTECYREWGHLYGEPC